MHVRPLFVSLCLLVKGFTCEANTESTLEDSELDPEGYYWRDYNNRIPKDAFPASFGVEPQYIAQVLHGDLLIPGVIDHSVTTDAIYEYGNAERESSTNIKIFCTDNPNALEWVETNTDDFSIDDDYIVGGYESGNKVFIGRSWEHGDPVVGKVIVHGSDPVVLHTTYGSQALRKRNFEVLRVARRSASPTTAFTSVYHVTSPRPRSEADYRSRVSTEHYDQLFHTSKPYYPLEPRFHRYMPVTPPRPYYRNWRPTRSWIDERFNSLRPSTSPRPRLYKEDHLSRGLSTSQKPRSVTLTNNEKCTCSKGTVIINFN
ncbi:hypothetical protein PPYR_13824 [Photinus pyralis]|uniref:Uncharacterized protein n=1 Tax=Photinus pyralis TaxID=7054 RepID=A0A1Y1LDX5_PHOPY|nr:uncharacterized protein LOC116178545 [Photinus pyralis]KAB0794204.1 hypothetical protein PPYR_13824 [Photinus pyralis]